MGIEFELKFRATPLILEQIREAVPGQEQKISMETTYYDTRENSLSGRKYTLRRRMENEKSVCTLKTPAGKLGRRELEVLCDSIETALPELCKLSGIAALAAITAQGVIPVCGARFTRIAKKLSLSGGSVELALDEGILMGGNREEPLCEVEVELKSGSMAMCDRFAEELSCRFSLKPEEKSKFSRALALYKGD